MEALNNNVDQILPPTTLDWTIVDILQNTYSSGPNNSGVLNKHGGWVISHALKNVWSGISVSLDFLLNLSAMNFFQRLKITTINDKK